MGVIIDVLIAAAILLAVFLGARSGLLQSLAGLLVVVASAVGAALAAGAFSDAATGWLRPMMSSRLSEKLDAAPGGVREMLSTFGFSGKPLAELAENITRQAAQTGQSVLDGVIDAVSHAIAYAGVFLVVFLALLLVLHLLVKSLELAAELPGLKTLNTVGGGVLGLIKGLLLVYAAVWVLRKLQLVITPELLEETMLLPLFVNYSPLSLLTGL